MDQLRRSSRGADLSVRHSDDDQHVAGEELGPGSDHEDEAHENAMPPRSRVGPQPSALSVMTIV